MGIRLKSLGLAALVILTWQLQPASSDTLYIQEIQCLRPATGLDGVAKKAISVTLGTLSGGIAAGAAYKGLFGAAIGTPAGLVLTSAAVIGGATMAALSKNIVEDLDKATSKEDDLYILVNGVKVFPKGDNDYKQIEKGDVIKPNVKFDSDDPFTIQLVEYDDPSSHDLLGQFSVSKNFTEVQVQSSQENWKCQIEKWCTVHLVNYIEGSEYKVTWKVERNDKKKGVQKWLQTGTSTYKECNEIMCRKTNDDDMDRDKDKKKGKDMDEDDDWLLDCPPGFQQRGYKKYPQVIGADVFLRICSSELEECKLSSDAAAEEKCKQVAEKMKLKTTGLGVYPFASRKYKPKGCYYYNKGTYDGYAFFGKGGKAAHWAGLGENTEDWGVQVIPLCRRIEYCPELSMSDHEAEELCKAIAGKELGKSTLGKGKKWAFASKDYTVKGCYFYTSASEEFEGQAYFGRGGKVTDWGKTNKYDMYERVPLCTSSTYEFEEDDAED